MTLQDNAPGREMLQTGGYSWSKRMEVVARYMLLGNMRLVSEQTNINYQTLMGWKNSEWWPEVVSQLKRQKQSKTNDSITKLIEQSLDVMQDRLDNGDFVFDQKTGEVKRKPVSVRDATQIATNLLQRQQIQEELDQKLNVKVSTVQETLSLIAQELKKHNKLSTGEVVDAKVIEHAVHDEWKEGLQEGSPSLYKQAGSNSETSGAE